MTTTKTKLEFLVHKFSGSTTDIDEIFSRLCKEHREYQRKDPKRIKEQIQEILQKENDSEGEQDAVMQSEEQGFGSSLSNVLRRPNETPKKRKKIRKIEAVPFLQTTPSHRYADLGGLQQVVATIRPWISHAFEHADLYRQLGAEPVRGILLRGPPGTGKTHLAHAVAGESQVSFFSASAPALVAGVSGESEQRIRTLFQAASAHAPSLIFLDELDAIAVKRANSGMEQRMVAQLLTCMDGIAPEHNRGQASVIVLAATNRPDALDPALRRAGRFDQEVILGVPDQEGRESILKALTSKMAIADTVDCTKLAKLTPGYVGADVQSLTKEAASISISRIVEGGDKTVCITMDDFMQALPKVQPSSQREGFATVPDVSWDNIGALGSIREKLTLSVLEPIRFPEKFKALGLSLPAGVLLFGPPGCGKTLLAKAIANESGANFISVKGPELLDKYVGESERAVRVVFERARASSPCVVFFDELDSLVPKRGTDGGGGGVSERVVNQLLTEMDGLESRRSVFVIAATNRPELIDPAMMRPGRLDKLLYVPLPSPDDRASILQTLGAKVQIDRNSVDLMAIGKSSRADGYSGADCAALLREAGLAVLKESHGVDASELKIQNRHFDVAFDHVLPSVSRQDHARYDRIRDRMARARSRAPQSKENPTAASES